MNKKLKDIAGSHTMSDKAKKWRKISFIVFGLASVVVSPMFPFSLPMVVINIATTIQMIGMATGLGAQSNTGKK